MNRDDNLRDRTPRTDDRSLWAIPFAVYGYPVLLIAHKLKLFSLLGEKPRTLEEVCGAVKIHARPAQALLGTAAALGFVELRDGRYALTDVAQEYLVESSPHYFGWHWALTYDTADVWSLAALERAVLTNSPQVQAPEDKADMFRRFTRAMHSISMAASSAWPQAVDLSKHRLMLDIGGGSGAHAIGAALAQKSLQAVVFDAPAVCEVAAEYIARYGLADRIKTKPGDMFADPFPAADLHFYSHVYHLWTPEKNLALTKKSYENLPSGGRIVIHEILYNDDKTGPFAAAAFDVIVLGWTEGQQYSGPELTSMLKEAGFREIQVTSTFGDDGIVTGIKP